MDKEQIQLVRDFVGEDIAKSLTDDMIILFGHQCNYDLTETFNVIMADAGGGFETSVAQKKKGKKSQDQTAKKAPPAEPKRPVSSTGPRVRGGRGAITRSAGGPPGTMKPFGAPRDNGMASRPPAVGVSGVPKGPALSGPPGQRPIQQPNKGVPAPRQPPGPPPASALPVNNGSSRPLFDRVNNMQSPTTAPTPAPAPIRPQNHASPGQAPQRTAADIVRSSLATPPSFAAAGAPLPPDALATSTQPQDSAPSPPLPSQPIRPGPTANNSSARMPHENVADVKWDSKAVPSTSDVSSLGAAPMAFPGSEESFATDTTSAMPSVTAKFSGLQVQDKVVMPPSVQVSESDRLQFGTFGSSGFGAGFGLDASEEAADTDPLHPSGLAPPSGPPPASQAEAVVQDGFKSAKVPAAFQNPTAQQTATFNSFQQSAAPSTEIPAAMEAFDKQPTSATTETPTAEAVAVQNAVPFYGAVQQPYHQFAMGMHGMQGGPGYAAYGELDQNAADLSRLGYPDPTAAAAGVPHNLYPGFRPQVSDENAAASKAQAPLAASLLEQNSSVPLPAAQQPAASSSGVTSSSAPTAAAGPHPNQQAHLMHAFAAMPPGMAATQYGHHHGLPYAYPFAMTHQGYHYMHAQQHYPTPYPQPAGAPYAPQAASNNFTPPLVNRGYPTGAPGQAGMKFPMYKAPSAGPTSNNVPTHGQYGAGFASQTPVYPTTTTANTAAGMGEEVSNIPLHQQHRARFNKETGLYMPQAPAIQTSGAGAGQELNAAPTSSYYTPAPYAQGQQGYSQGDYAMYAQGHQYWPQNTQMMMQQQQPGAVAGQAGANPAAGYGNKQQAFN